MPRGLRPIARSILNLDGAEHKRIRAAVDQRFSRASIDALRPEIIQIADAHLDRLDTTQPVNITTHYARLLPLDVISALLGIQPTLRRDLAKAIAPISGPIGVAALFRILPGLFISLKILRAEIKTIRTTPRAGLLSDIIHDKTNDLSDDEIISLAFTLFVAGHETTLHLLSDAIFALTDGATLGENTPLAVEEFMRYFSPVLMTKPMFVRKNVTFHGHALKQGDKVLALLISANHDPARFTAPETLQLERRPNAHIGFGFGFGPHVCLGMHLARAEMQIALERLFQRFPDLQRVPQHAPAN